jgi:hypothetical protein
MNNACPLCKSVAVVAHRTTHKTATAIGGVAGAIQGASSAIATSRNPSASTRSDKFGAIARVVVSTLLGGAAGCATGAAMSEAIDSAKRHTFCCQTCGHLF